MKLSVIIPAYNHLDKVLRCLNTLQDWVRANPDPLATEYIVQDDASPEYDLSELVPDCVASVERNPLNLGFPGNVNQGAARASGDVLFIVNQDVYATFDWGPWWDVELLKAFDNPAVGIVGARLLFPNGSVQSVGGVFDGKKQPHHRCLGWSNPLHPDANEARKVSWVTGAALAVRRDVWQQLGGFDVSYVGGYFEDVDLCVRAQLAGHEVWFEPGVTLIHEVGSTGGSPHFMRSAQLFRERWERVIEPDTMAVYERFW